MGVALSHGPLRGPAGRDAEPPRPAWRATAPSLAALMPRPGRPRPPGHPGRAVYMSTEARAAAALVDGQLVHASRTRRCNEPNTAMANRSPGCTRRLWPRRRAWKAKGTKGMDAAPEGDLKGRNPLGKKAYFATGPREPRARRPVARSNIRVRPWHPLRAARPGPCGAPAWRLRPPGRVSEPQGKSNACGPPQAAIGCVSGKAQAACVRNRPHNLDFLPFFAPRGFWAACGF